MQIEIPELSLVLLIGPAGCGKTSFAHRHFKKTEILSSDFCRGLVADDENDQDASKDAFDILYYILEKRLKTGRLSVIDATNIQTDARKQLLQRAQRYHVMPVAIVLNLPEEICQERNRRRRDRIVEPDIISEHVQDLQNRLDQLKAEGYHRLYILNTPEEIDSACIVRGRMRSNRRDEDGPFDIVGDIHGCFDELVELLGKLGYNLKSREEEHSVPRYEVVPPEGRKAIFLGDLVDRGPKIVETLSLVMDMVEAGNALCLPGNHDVKLLRRLRGQNVKVSFGLAESLEQLDRTPPEFIERVKHFISGLVSHYVLDEGNLVVAHAGMKRGYQGRHSRAVKHFALYGETTGETDEFGLPVRYNWAQDYRGRAWVVYGHTPVPQPEWLNRTINIDTGCVFGGRLTALRWPENELLSVPARAEYTPPHRPFLPHHKADNANS